jgi:hypothetical protein
MGCSAGVANGRVPMAQEQICANDENTILQIDEGDVGRVAIVPYIITGVIM